MRPGTLALLLMCLSALTIPVGDAFAKEIQRTTEMGPAPVILARFLLGAALFLPLSIAFGQAPLLTPRFLAAQALRGLCVAGGITGMVNAVGHAPLADVFGAFFIAPAAATLLAWGLLGERVTRRDLLSLGLGLLGVLLVTRPSAEMNPGLLWALFGGLSYGAFNAATRWSAPLGRPLGQLAGQLVFGCVLALPFGAAEIGRAGEAPWLLIGSGLFSALANLFLVMAYARERAAVLAPLIYLQLPSAAFLGWAAFGDLPDLLASAGLALIVFAGLGLRLLAPRR